MVHSIAEGKRVRPDEYRNHPYVVNIGLRMRMLGLSMDDMVRRSGVSQPQLSIVLNGRQNPETITLFTHTGISDALGLSLATLLQWAGHELYKYDDVIPEDIRNVTPDMVAAVLSPAERSQLMSRLRQPGP